MFSSTSNIYIRYTRSIWHDSSIPHQTKQKLANVLMLLFLQTDNQLEFYYLAHLLAYKVIRIRGNTYCLTVENNEHFLLRNNDVTGTIHLGNVLAWLKTMLTIDVNNRPEQFVKPLPRL